MALDRYSKVVFTVIALALAALAVGQFMPEKAKAAVAGMDAEQLADDSDFGWAVLFVLLDAGLPINELMLNNYLRRYIEDNCRAIEGFILC